MAGPNATNHSPIMASTTISITGPHADCHVSRRFMELRENNQLTDYEIHIGGDSFLCHGQLLAVHSPVILAMITTDMQEKMTKQIRFPEVAPRIVRAILDYLYSGRCRFEMEDACPMIEATHFLELTELIDLCVQQLIPRIAPDNVIGFCRLAERCDLADLKMSCQDILCSCLKDVIMELSFLDLNVDEIASYIAIASQYGTDDFLLVTAAFVWVTKDIPNRTGVLENLLQKADLLKCSAEQMQNILNNFQNVLQQNPSFYRLFTEAYVRRKIHQSLFVLGMNVMQKMWTLENGNQFTVIDTSLRKGILSCYRSVCRYSTKAVIVTGGYNCKICIKWTVNARNWDRLPDLLYNRYRHASICIGDMLFVFGGIIRGRWCQNVNILLLDGSTWNRGPKLPVLLKGPKVSSLGADIYVLGNHSVASPAAEMFCLDTSTMTWSTKATCVNAGFGFSVATFASNLMVAGGNMHVCKWYDPPADVWTELTKPLLTHSFGSLLVYETKLILMGGHTKLVEQYDENTDSWSVLDMKLPSRLSRPTALILDEYSRP